MRVLIDTNIILNWLMTREPFQEKAKSIMETCFFGDMDGYVTAHTLSDIFYILRKDFDMDKRKKLLLLLCEHRKYSVRSRVLPFFHTKGASCIIQT